MAAPTHLPIHSKLWFKILVICLFSLILYFPLFMHLGVMPVNLWDESLFALRALHYYDYGSYMPIFSVFEAMPDHHNAKLPFTTWIQAGSMHLFGVNELALRLPVALIFAGSSFYMIHFARKYWGNLYAGLLFGLILVSDSGLVENHLLRTGDQDVPFACFGLLGVLFFYLFVEKRKSRHICLSALAFIAAFLTKNLLAGLFLPGLLLYTLYRGQFISLLRDWRLWAGLVAVAASYIACVLFLDEQFPGFWQRMWNYELMGRYTETIEDKHGSVWYYADLLFLRGLRLFSPLLLLGLVSTFDRRMRPALRHSLVATAMVWAFYLLVISFSETKNGWYAAPLYPLSGVLMAGGCLHLYEQYLRRAHKSFKIAAFGILTALLGVGYYNAIDFAYKPKPLINDHRYGTFIPELQRNFDQLDSLTITDGGWGTAAYFIAEKYDRGSALSVHYQREMNYKPGEEVIICQGKDYDEIRKLYELEKLYSDGFCNYLRIVGRR